MGLVLGSVCLFQKKIAICAYLGYNVSIIVKRVGALTPTLSSTAALKAVRLAVF